jgi:hypothetical protein
MNIALAIILSSILTLVMLAPKRLEDHFAADRRRRQRNLKARRHAPPAEVPDPRRSDAEHRGLRPIPD